MSSLRVATLRLCWLEAFVTVAEQENISAAARELNLDQSTVTRYLQRLENWLGKKLIKPGAINDPQNPGVSIGLTDEGREFHTTASHAIAALSGARSEAAERAELMEEMSTILGKIEVALATKKSPLISPVRQNVDFMRKVFSSLPDETPMLFLEQFGRRMRFFFTDFEKLSQKRLKATPATEFDEAIFERMAENAGVEFGVILSDVATQSPRTRCRQ